MFFEDRLEETSYNLTLKHLEYLKLFVYSKNENAIKSALNKYNEAGKNYQLILDEE